jgi:EAL domain-containing protein (putative c-di-GMP-specific phosphodiesterase class I)/ActR/RegA family two-component response regulator
MQEERLRVLIIDDDCDIKTILDEFLSRSYDCVSSDSAENALALLRMQHFDIIMSDITMPRMTGLQMLPHIRMLAPDSVVVMISGQRAIEFAIAAMRAGASDYITKPFDLSEVDAVVKRAIEHRRRIQKSRADEGGSNAAVRELRTAVEQENFIVHYQPQFNIKTCEVVGAEALIRWQHPDRGLLFPGDFIPLAERTGLIDVLGETVLRMACAQTRDWMPSGCGRFRIAVNVSPRQLCDQSFPDKVTQILAEMALAPERLEIEVTETSLIENAELGIQALERLRDMGVRIAIDDFGIGYSSLAYLKRLPIDSVKLDVSFVKHATTDPDDAALVMAIINLAHNLRLKVIAEGIEREDQLAFLRLLRCDEGQGYLFGEPAPAEAMTMSLRYAHTANLAADERMSKGSIRVAQPPRQLVAVA